MQATIDAINALADTLPSRFPQYSKNVVSHVVQTLKDKLGYKGAPILNKRDVEAVRAALIYGNNARSRLSWLHHDCFNRLVYELTKKNLLSSYYINTLIKLNRHVLVDIDDNTADMIQYVAALRDHLLAFKAFAQDDLAAAEQHHACSAYAACCIFGHTTLPDFHDTFFSLTIDRFTADPLSISVPFKNSDTFYRYFLPAPAAVHVYKYLLFRMNHRARLAELFPKDASEAVFSARSFSSHDFPRIFDAWATGILSSQGMVPKERLKLPSFRKAIIAMAVSDFSGDGTVDAGPPFVLAVHAREIKSFSYDSVYLDYLLKGSKTRVNHASPVPTTPTRPPFSGLSGLEKAIKEIREFITPLKRQKPSKMAHRAAAAHDINVLAEDHRGRLSPADYDNLSLYIDWVSNMLHDRSLAVKSVCDYSSGVPNFLFSLSDVGALREMETPQLVDILHSTMSKYNSVSIRKALKYFTEFVEHQNPGRFRTPDWMKTKALFKPDIPVRKPLIVGRDVSDAIELCDDVFTAHAPLIRGEGFIRRASKQLWHKSEAIKQIILLGFYAGLRIVEITNLRVNNVIYDGGIVLCIRVTKTINGVRNIPLNLLAPEHVVNSFRVYLGTKMGSRQKDALIFAQENGEPWDTSHVSSEVTRVFNEIGMGGIRFQHLRHSFANFFLLRWLVAFHQDIVPSDAPFLHDELFNNENIANLRELFLSRGGVKKGQENFTYALAVLARLMGHGGPMITLEKYVHNVDWLFYLLSHHWGGKTVFLTSIQAQDILSLSYPSLPANLKGRGLKTITLNAIVELQRQRFDALALNIRQ